MHMSVKNIFAGCADTTDGAEDFLTLFENTTVRIERIVSHSHASPPGFWFDQPDDEWVLVLQGSASLEFDGGEFVDLNAGDYLIIPRHVKHRIAGTGKHTVWLAVHVK